MKVTKIAFLYTILSPERVKGRYFHLPEVKSTLALKRDSFYVTYPALRSRFTPVTVIGRSRVISSATHRKTSVNLSLINNLKSVFRGKKTVETKKSTYVTFIGQNRIGNIVRFVQTGRKVFQSHQEFAIVRFLPVGTIGRPLARLVDDRPFKRRFLIGHAGLQRCRIGRRPIRFVAVRVVYRKRRHHFQRRLFDNTGDVEQFGCRFWRGLRRRHRRLRFRFGHVFVRVHVLLRAVKQVSSHFYVNHTN